MLNAPLYLSLPDATAEWRSRVAQAFSSQGHATLSRDDRDPDKPWPTELQRLMARANTLITLLSPSGHDAWQLREQALWPGANSRANSALVLPPNSDLPAALAYPRPWAILSDPQTLDALPAAVEQALAARASDTGAAPQNPYPGLRPYRSSEAALFFGRRQELQQLQKRIQRYPLVVLSSAPGTGKRSLIAAGLFPTSRSTTAFADGPWECISIIPGAAPFHALAHALTALLQPDATAGQQRRAADDLANQWHVGSLDLAPVIARMLRVQNGSKGLLLHLQQLDALLPPQPDTTTHAAAFLRLLLSAATRQPLKIIASVNSRWQALLLKHLPALSQQAEWMTLAPLQAGQLREAVCAPARLAGIEVEPGLLQQLLSDAGQSSGHPAMLACVLYHSWQRRAGSQLDAAAYHAVGGLKHCLEQQAEAAWRKLSAEQQHRLRQHWHEHVNARQQSLADPADDDPAQSWQRSRRWHARHIAFQAWHVGISDAAAAWQQNQRTRNALLRGPEQKEAEVWLARQGQQLSETEREFIRAGQREKSHKAGLRRARRRQTGLAIALGISLTALGISASQWWLATHDSRHRAGDPSIANNTAPASIESYPPRRGTLPAPAHASNSDSALPLNTTPILLTVPGDRVNDIAFSGDGRFLLTASSSGSINLWEIASGDSRQQLDAGERPLDAIHFFDRQRQFASISIDATILRWNLPGRHPQPIRAGGHDRVTATAFSASGNRLLVADSSRRLNLYDLLAGRHLTRLKGHLAEVIAIDLSPDDTRIISADEAGDIWLWNGIDLKPLQHRRGHRNFIDQLQFDPTGERFLSAGGDGHIRLWSSKDATPLLDINAADERIHAARFSPTGATLASAVGDGTISLWDSHSGNRIATLKGHGDAVRSLAFSPGGHWLASAGDDHSVRLWPLAGGEPTILRSRHATRLTDLKFDPTGHWLAATGSNANLLLWAIPRPPAMTPAEMASR